MPLASDLVIGTILKHDRKNTSYKIALVRAINDVVLLFPDMASESEDEIENEQSAILIPLRMLAQFWVPHGGVIFK